MTIREGLYKLAEWSDGVGLYRAIGEATVLSLGGGGAWEKEGKIALFALMRSDAQLIALITVELKHQKPVLIDIIMDGHPASIYNLDARNKLLWVIFDVIDLTRQQMYLSAIEELGLPRFTLEIDVVEFRSRVAEINRDVDKKLPVDKLDQMDFLITSHLAMKHMSAVKKLISYSHDQIPLGLVRYINPSKLEDLPQSTHVMTASGLERDHSLLSIGHHGITNLVWYPGSREYGLKVPRESVPPYALNPDLVALLAEYFFVMEPIPEWIADREDVGTMTYDDELYRLMREEVPALWERTEFTEWAAAIGLEPEGT